MRAGVFIRYNSGDGFGHVGWAFEVSPGLVDAGSVENHSGHIFTPATQMGFWNGCFSDPVAKMREHRYDDLKIIDVPNCNPQLARRTVRWIADQAYRAWHRNCEDDAYDVLRAYGVHDLATPSLIWFPKTWFARFRGELVHVSQFEWDGEGGGLDCARHALRQAQDDNERAQDDEGAWRPTWRRGWHPQFHALKLRRLQLVFHRH